MEIIGLMVLVGAVVSGIFFGAPAYLVASGVALGIGVIWHLPERQT